MTDLMDHIRGVIRADGPISIAKYMELALLHPVFGYYKKKQPLGTSGDFITSPEVSQMFGELVGLWLAEVWRAMGMPKPFLLLEMGPGRGTLLLDALRATQKVQDFHQALKLYLYECNDLLREEQKSKLDEFKPIFIDDLNDLPALPTLVVANEFFDAMPVHQLVQIELQGEKVWAERKVGLLGEELKFVYVPPFADGIRGDVVYHESSPQAAGVMQMVVAQIVRHGGAALVIDYGYISPSGQSTLQSVKAHQHVDVLSCPGEADVTVHVDFAVLRQKAIGQGARVLGPVDQGDFLRAMGIETRAKLLQKNSSKQEGAEIEEALKRLTDPMEMGSLFKAMAVLAPPLKDVPGFE